MKEIKISVPPSNNIFGELKKTSSDYNFRVALSEIIDNSIGSMVGTECDVNVNVQGNWTEGNQNSLSLDKDAKIIISDNASGISLDKIGFALSPAGLANKQKNSLHEHGMGLKTALRNLGTSEILDTHGNIVSIGDFQILTAPIDSDKVYLIDKMNYNDLSIYETNDKSYFVEGHGTIITILNLDKIFTARKDYSRILIPFLGQRYQQILSGIHGKKLKLTIMLTSKNGTIIKSDGREMKFEVQPVKPVWASEFPAKTSKLPMGTGAKFKDWSAEIKFGYNPSEDELMLFTNYEDIYKPYAKSTHPYNINSQKIDIFANDVLLCQKDFSWLFDIQDGSVARYFRNTRPRLQVFLYRGFQSSFTKNDVQDSINLGALKEAIRSELSPFLEDKYWPKGDTEEKLKDELTPKLEKFYNDVQREVNMPDCGLRADYSLFNPKLAQKEIWEVKIGEAGAPDFIQLLGYLMTSDIKNGVLLAKSFNDHVNNLAKDVNKNFSTYGISIRLEPLATFF